jgi:uncharacterized protein (DUF4415 family)
MSPKNKNIQYGKKDLLPKDAFAPKNVKMRISIMLDLDVIDEFKARGAKQREGYQTLINKALREYLWGLKPFGGLTKEELLKMASDPESTFIKKLKSAIK